MGGDGYYKELPVEFRVYLRPGSESLRHALMHKAGTRSLVLAIESLLAMATAQNPSGAIRNRIQIGVRVIQNHNLEVLGERPRGQNVRCTACRAELGVESHLLIEQEEAFAARFGSECPGSTAPPAAVKAKRVKAKRKKPPRRRPK